MKNDTSNGNPEEAIACIAMSKIGRVMSASGSKVSLFCVKTCRLLSTSNGPPLSFIAFHPEACEIVAFGMIDGTILVCSYFGHQARVELRGHQNMITGLAFPRARIVLVSSSADGQICVWWGLSGVVKKRSRYIQSSEKWPGPLVGDTRVQFQSDSTDFLVVHKSQLAIYNLDLECLCLVSTFGSIDFLLISDYIQWSPRDTLPAPISSAVYSCDYLLVYTGFCDGAIGIFEAKSLSLRCRIAPYAYVPPSISLSVGHIYPVVVSAHPSKPNQIALGMSDGTVHVLEPLDEDPNQGGEHLLLMSNDNGADP
ncbi:hypothetical protein U9M48_040785 [Paspalum notatum var. saurae]|uniref:Uncharacterized protein n=1 Tax=Paspalum notatum var. saurae TaxID=547442 RepID=A0AAQ3XFX1_PASNO